MLEWIVGGLGAVLVGGAIAFLVYHALTRDLTPPDVRVVEQRVLVCRTATSCSSGRSTRAARPRRADDRRGAHRSGRQRRDQRGGARLRAGALEPRGWTMVLRRPARRAAHLARDRLRRAVTPGAIARSGRDPAARTYRLTRPESDSGRPLIVTDAGRAGRLGLSGSPLADMKEEAAGVGRLQGRHRVGAEWWDSSVADREIGRQVRDDLRHAAAAVGMLEAAGLDGCGDDQVVGTARRHPSRERCRGPARHARAKRPRGRCTRCRR